MLRGDECVTSPVKPVGWPASYFATAARSRRAGRMVEVGGRVQWVVEVVNGGGADGRWELEMRSLGLGCGPNRDQGRTICDRRC